MKIRFPVQGKKMSHTMVSQYSLIIITVHYYFGLRLRLIRQRRWNEIFNRSKIYLCIEYNIRALFKFLDTTNKIISWLGYRYIYLILEFNNASRTFLLEVLAVLQFLNLLRKLFLSSQILTKWEISRLKWWFQILP